MVTLVARGKLKMVAIVAAVRKYLTILNALTRDHLKAIAAQAKYPSPEAIWPLPRP